MQYNGHVFWGKIWSHFYHITTGGTKPEKLSGTAFVLHYLSAKSTSDR